VQVLTHTPTALPATLPLLLLPAVAAGALVGNAVILFKLDASLTAPPVTSVSFSLPPGAPAPSKVLVTGLVPGAPYTLTNPGGAYVVTQGGSQLADASGAVLL